MCNSVNATATIHVRHSGWPAYMCTVYIHNHVNDLVEAIVFFAAHEILIRVAEFVVLPRK